MLGFLGAPLPIAGVFFAVGLVLILVRYPTRQRAFGPVEERFGATLG